MHHLWEVEKFEGRSPKYCSSFWMNHSSQRQLTIAISLPNDSLNSMVIVMWFSVASFQSWEPEDMFIYCLVNKYILSRWQLRITSWFNGTFSWCVFFHFPSYSPSCIFYLLVSDMHINTNQTGYAFKASFLVMLGLNVWNHHLPSQRHHWNIAVWKEVWCLRH